MRLRLSACVAAATLVAATSASAAGPATPASGDVSIPFTKTTLPNGMTVILSEDHTLPLVVVNVGYWVGSRFEEPRRTGFAHLFEHLMFMGTERAPRHKFDEVMEASGGSNNAFTTEDRTDYFEVGPPGIVDLDLWLEADRMRDLGRVMTQEKLDLQRDVVRNERRQSVENQPYGKVELRLPELLYPEGHPYHHPVIGSHEDLEAAQVPEVKAFFAKWYDPSNAVLCVAGDFDAPKTMDKIQAWFATIPSKGKPQDPGAVGADGKGFDSSKTTLKSVVRDTLQDNVELPKTVMAWQTPKHFAPGDAELDLAAAVLSHGKESRLYQALVYEQKLAQDVDVTEYSHVLGSAFIVDATARPGVSLDKLEAAIDVELEKIRKAPVTDEELTRAKNGFEAAYVQRLQSINARAEILVAYQAEMNDPGYATKDLERYRVATAAGVKDAVSQFLDPNARVILRVVPKTQAPPKEPPKADKAGNTESKTEKKGGAK
jgi:predicted Zn-dependent peptidase